MSRPDDALYVSAWIAFGALAMVGIVLVLSESVRQDVWGLFLWMIGARR